MVCKKFSVSLTFQKFAAVCLLLFVLTGCASAAMPKDISTVTPAEVHTETPTIETTETPTEMPTIEPTETPTETPTIEPTETPTETPTIEPTETPTKEMVTLSQMTLEEKVGQLFICSFWGAAEMTEEIESVISVYNIGGVVMFSENIQDSEQIKKFIEELQKSSKIPLFIAVDEEGGRVTRTGALDVPRIQPALEIGRSNEAQSAYDAAVTIADYIGRLGFNVNFAPVADVFTNSANTVIGDRAFSGDAVIAREMVSQFTRGTLDRGILPALKHFPGHGDTAEDSHNGMAKTDKTFDELRECELVPFEGGIEAGAPFVMVGHISAPNITGNDEPAIFSSLLLQDVLRAELGFSQIIITDALNMGAVTKYYTTAEIVEKSLLAGVDILLMPNNFKEAYEAVISAVKRGTVTEERLDASVHRILKAKEGFY